MIDILCFMTGATLKPNKTLEDCFWSVYLDETKLISHASEQRCETVLLALCDRYYSGYGSKETEYGTIASTIFYHFDRMKYKIYRTRLGLYVFDAPITRGGKLLFYTEDAKSLESWTRAQYKKWREVNGKQKKSSHRRVEKDSKMRN